jgi:3-oxoacyl-[acyl-carrier-protein] synthase II
MNRRRRVVVTGLGLATPLGLDVDENWGKLLGGISGVDRPTLSDSQEAAIRAVAQVRDSDWQRIRDEFKNDFLTSVGRENLFALWAVKEALRDAGVVFVLEGRRNYGFISAAGLGTIKLEDIQERINEQGEFDFADLVDPHNRVRMESFARYHAYGASALIAQQFGLNGATVTVTSACASATQAIGLGSRWIRRGDADLLVCGGADSMVNPVGLVFFLLLTAASTSTESPATVCRPFDRKRSGLVIGEGAGFVVLEELSHALAREAEIYAEVVGYASSMDAYQVTAPHPEGRGAAKCMRMALEDANLTVADIDYINAHGTATKLNDVAETIAIKTVFGEYAKQIAISSSKSMIGHLMAASGGPEFIYTVLSIKNDVIHPTINLDQQDPKCDLDYVPKVKRTKLVRAALSNSFGFGGQNATIVVSKFAPNHSSPGQGYECRSTRE